MLKCWAHDVIFPNYERTMSETITYPGSGLVFNNTYSQISSRYYAGYRDAVITAENDLQGYFTSSITLNVRFRFAPLPLGEAAENAYDFTRVSYSSLRAALSGHATTADDFAAVNSLPASDPSKGTGFDVPNALAIVLGLASSNTDDTITVTLNSRLAGWQFQSDAVGAIEHEISEGGMGRLGGLGYAIDTANQASWGPMDLFRYSAPNQRNYSPNGSHAYFSVDGANLSTNLEFHNQNDDADFADWEGYSGDAFGAAGPRFDNFLSGTDLRILDILGWTPSATSSGASPAASASNGQTVAGVPVFRFFDTHDGGHFFTTSTAERNQLFSTRSDLQFEGVGFLSDNAADSGVAAVYRFFAAQDGGHFFTTSQSERDQVIATRPDLRFEGVGFYESASPAAGNTPVYRFFDTRDGGHFFTTSEGERAALATRPDLHFEGIGFYAPMS